MKLQLCAALGLLSLAAADSNTTLSSKNILPSTFTPPPHFRNVNLVRNINVEKSYPRETINVVIENIAGQAQSEYYLPFEEGTITRTGGLEVKDKKQPERTGFVVELLDSYYKITFPTPLPANEQLTLSISYSTLSALTPLPAQIAQTDKQYLHHAFSAYTPSFYPTSKQKTKLKLPTIDVPDASTLPATLNAEGKQDPQKQGTTYTYGPYSDIPALSPQPVTVRYEFTKPLIHSTLLERDIEISHWGGNLAIEERHWLLNRAASLKNHFSRVTYQQSAYYNPPSSALREMRFPLAVGSADPYFIDDIGNVSTSRFRSNLREANLEAKPRYPVFGGWRYSFKVGWNGELKTFLRKVKGGSNEFVLKVPFFEGLKQVEGVEYEKIVTRVILPEGAT